MLRPDLKTELQEMIRTDRYTWSSGSFDRAIEAAIRDFNRDRPLHAYDNLQLQVGARRYTVPNACLFYLGSDWGADAPRSPPWTGDFPGAKPRVNLVANADQTKSLVFTPAPTERHLTAYGCSFEYHYSAGHIIDATQNTVLPEDQPLFQLRCLVALMEELIAANVTDPIQMHRGVGSALPNNATPLAAKEALMKSYLQQVGRA